MLKGGVIGFGRMGMTHYSILNVHSDVQFVAVCDPSKFLLKNLRRYTSLELFTDYRKMLDIAEMDFVIVATPPDSHAEIVRIATAKGIHMFVEKPFCLSLRDGNELVTALEDNKIVNQVGYFLRFNVVFDSVKKIIEKGLIGDVIHYKNEMYGRTVLKPSKTSWRSKKDMGGGCLPDFASHCIDLSGYLLGPVESVSGSLLKQVYSSNVEDAVYTTLRHADGISGNLMVCWSDDSYRRPYNRIEILGTRGKIIADKQEYRLYLREADGDAGFTKGWNIYYLPELEKGTRFNLRGAEFTEQLDHFIKCIKEGTTETICSFADAVRTDHVMEEIMKDFTLRSS